MNDQKLQVPTPHNICAIVVTYNPDEGLPERLERIWGQVDKEIKEEVPYWIKLIHAVVVVS